ncbi:hypothetical protein E2562_016761 [Oryza meyeriana var. granulata]|uniref:Uncharacterized protein n=1 Tax=Oryza meyeriana var. granulata TaxID=110450 RepID=A0A6G1BLQ4_9ORYZ|nr:hypothetical protein E2562_016761 [Oryza meyeriana var. granulata]
MQPRAATKGGISSSTSASHASTKQVPAASMQATQASAAAPFGSMTAATATTAVTDASGRTRWEKKLNPAQLVEWRKLGLCYIAMKNTPAAIIGDCPGIKAGKSMQLEVQLSDTSLQALVDSSSTHCFLFVYAAKRLGVRMHPIRLGMRVTVANAEKLGMTGQHVRRVF